MYKIQAMCSDDQYETVYDPTQLETTSFVISPKASLQLNEAGTVTFTLLPGHPLYGRLMPLATFIRVLDDNVEIFYGRILQRSEPTLTGQVSFTCEGALTFLIDSEIEPYGKSSNGTAKTKTMTAEAFFRSCITEHNDFVDDPRREFVVGTVSASQKSKEDKYSISNWTQTKSAIESNILNAYGGFIRIRERESSGHYIDWVEEYDTLNPQEISIGVNLEDQTNQIDSNQLFTVLRPIGDNNLELDEKTLDVYSVEDIQRYGRIVKTVTFNGATTKAQLRTKAQAYISRLQKTMFINSSIQLVDMHYLDGTVPKIRLGDRFNNISGLSGEEMTVAGMEIDFEHPENTTLDLKNAKSLMPDLTPEGNGHGTNKMSRSHARSTGTGLKYYTELNDLATITVPELQISVDNFKVGVREQFLETAAEFNRISSRVDSVDGITNELDRIVKGGNNPQNGLQYKVTQIEGTGVIQNSAFISELSGKFEIWRGADGSETVHLKDGAEIAVDDHNGGTITVGQLNESYGNIVQEVTNHGVVIDHLTGSALWTQRDNITGLVGEFDVESNRIEDPPGSGTYRIEKRLVVKSGGGLKIKRDNVEYGVYDNGNLTGGLIVQKINGQSAVKVRGDRVILGSDLSNEDLNSWATEAKNGTGVFAKFLTVNKLTAQTINSVFSEGDAAVFTYVTVGDNISSKSADIQNLYVGPNYLEVDIHDADVSNNGQTLNIYKVRGGRVVEFQRSAVSDITVSADGKTLTITKFGSNTPINFSKPASSDSVTALAPSIVTLAPHGAGVWTPASIRVRSVASNGSVSDYKTLSFMSGTYLISNSQNNHCVAVTDGSNIVGLYSVESLYNSAYSSGQSSITSNGKEAQTYYPTSLNDRTIAAGTYLSGDQVIKKVITDKIVAGNIKYNETIKVGDEENPGRIKNITGTFTSIVSDGQTKATASRIASGYSAFVDGNEIKGSMTTKAAATYNVSLSDRTIAAGQYLNGTQTIKAVVLTNLTEGNIKNGVTVQVGDSNFKGRLAIVTGTCKTWENYYDSSYWQKPNKNNGWVCKCPKRDGSGSEVWFDVDSIGYSSGGCNHTSIGSYWYLTIKQNGNGSKTYTLKKEFSVSQTLPSGLTDGGNYTLYK